MFITVTASISLLKKQHNGCFVVILKKVDLSLLISVASFEQQINKIFSHDLTRSNFCFCMQFIMIKSMKGVKLFLKRARSENQQFLNTIAATNNQAQSSHLQADT